MSHHERGAYTPPTDAPLAFEARQPVRGARPFPLTLVLSLVVLVGLAAAIFVFYRSGVRQGPPRAVGQPVGDISRPAPPDVQPQDEAEGLQIYRSENGQAPPSAPPSFTPPPEAPQPRPQVSAPPPPAAAPTTPIASAPAPPLRPAHAPPAAAAEPARPKVEAKPVAAEPAASRRPEAAAAPAKAGGVSAQVGAVSSPQLADRTWNEAVGAAPGLAAGKGKGVEKVETGGKTLYRTLVTGFAGRAEAQAFCTRLKAAGKACFVR